MPTVSLQLETNQKKNNTGAAEDRGSEYSFQQDTEPHSLFHPAAWTPESFPSSSEASKTAVNELDLPFADQSKAGYPHLLDLNRGAPSFTASPNTRILHLRRPPTTTWTNRARPKPQTKRSTAATTTSPMLSSAKNFNTSPAASSPRPSSTPNPLSYSTSPISTISTGVRPPTVTAVPQGSVVRTCANPDCGIQLVLPIAAKAYRCSSCSYVTKLNTSTRSDTATADSTSGNATLVSQNPNHGSGRNGTSPSSGTPPVPNSVPPEPPHPTTQRRSLESTLASAALSPEPSTTHSMPLPTSVSSPVTQIAGLGIVLAIDTANNGFFVKSVAPGGPASLHSSIAPGDRVLTVGGRPVAGLPLREVRSMIVGPVGSNVVIETVRLGTATQSGSTTKWKLTRATASVASPPMSPVPNLHDALVSRASPAQQQVTFAPVPAPQEEPARQQGRDVQSLERELAAVRVQNKALQQRAEEAEAALRLAFVGEERSIIEARDLEVKQLRAQVREMMRIVEDAAWGR